MKFFQPPKGDPLLAEHEAILRWVQDASDSSDYYGDIELNAFPSGKSILDADPVKGRRYVLAALTELRCLDHEAARFRGKGKTELERCNPHLRPGWRSLWERRRLTEAVIRALMRRALPLEKQDLLALLDWCGAIERLGTYCAPVGSIVKALTRYAAEHSLEPDLQDAAATFAQQLRRSNDKEAKRLGTVVAQLCADERPDDAPPQTANRQATPSPVPAGNRAILFQLKRTLGVGFSDWNPVANPIGPDRFDLPEDSPLKFEHNLLSRLFSEVVGTPLYSNPSLDTEVGREIRSGSPAAAGRMLLAAAERHIAALLETLALNEPQVWQSRYAAAGLIRPLSEQEIEFSRDELFDFLLYLAARLAYEPDVTARLMPALLSQSEREHAAGPPITEGERYVLHLVRESLISGPPLGAPSDTVVQLTWLIGDAATFYLVPGEVWTDRVNEEMSGLEPTRRRQWVMLLRHLLAATGARPSDKWLKQAGNLVTAIGTDHVRDALVRWLPLVPKGRTRRSFRTFVGDTRGAADVMHEENATCLRSFLWLIPALPEAHEFVGLVTAVALSAYRKVPGVGPRAVKVGNAAVYALSKMASPETVGQLAMLKVRVRFGTAQKEIDKAFDLAAEALKVPRDEIEEMSVPSYGLEQVGLRRERFLNGQYAAELRVDGRNVTVSWSRADGKRQKSIPARVASEQKEELKQFLADAKNIPGMVSAQAERIDSLFLLQKSWPLATWRERYLDHPLVGTIARRLIWTFRQAGGETVGVWLNDRLVDIDENVLSLPADTEVALWHPIGRPIYEVLAWRARLEDRQITQPFKQAHREIYMLTDAEKQTGTYSNRFAAHILRQHQFNALCAARGWRNKLRMMVDDVYPPARRELPAWGMRCEFWIEGIGDNYGTDTSESGAYLRLSADQVRFYRIEASATQAHAAGGGYSSTATGPGDENVNDPLPLEQVPPLVFSEVMRDVDLFVGVASVGNDPTWQDGGPEGRYREYWHSYSFGELTESAKTRREAIERILPRLKIASRCSLSGRFLVVRGDLRTYKIHLGSGNILMEPNDQYLCIVPSSAAASLGSDGRKLFLPFEGDATLSVILSKAFLLAEDTRITDPTITRQLRKV